MVDLDEHTKDRIIEATYKAVRKSGVDGLRVQHIGTISGLSPGAMYRYFGSKEELLEACFYAVDRQAAAIYDHLELDLQQVVDDPSGTFHSLWQPYYRFWLAHPDETLFYHRFLDRANFPAFDKERDRSYLKNFSRIVAMFQTAYPGLTRMNRGLLWLHILTGTVTYAKYVVEGALPDTQETEDAIFQLIASGLSGFLKGPSGGDG